MPTTREIEMAEDIATLKADFRNLKEQMEDENLTCREYVKKLERRIIRLEKWRGMCGKMALGWAAWWGGVLIIITTLASGLVSYWDSFIALVEKIKELKQ